MPRRPSLPSSCLVVNQDDRLTCHPTVDEPLFIPRLGYEQQRLLPVVRDHGVRMTAAPLYYMAPNPELALFATASAPLGLALDPCAHHRQLPLLRRSASFRDLPYGSCPTVSDSDRDPISAVREAYRLSREERRSAHLEDMPGDEPWESILGGAPSLDDAIEA